MASSITSAIVSIVPGPPCQTQVRAVLKLNPASVPNTELNLGDRVLDEVEKKSFIALPGKGGHSGLMPSRLCVLT